MVVSSGLYIIQTYTSQQFPQILLISSFFFPNRLFGQYSVLVLSVFVPKDTCIQQNNQLMPDPSIQVLNVKTEVRAEFKLHPW